MAFTEYTKDTKIIGALGTNPAERALTTQEFKDKFDQFAHEFVAWFNATHVVEADAHLADTVSDVDGAHGLKIEKGTWTPYLLGEDTAGTWTAGSGNMGEYIKIHDRIFCTFAVQGTLASAVGNLCLAGLPFTPTGSILSHGNITANDIATGLLGLLNGGNISQPRIYSAGATIIDAATLSGEKFALGVFEFNI
jgi:hypothetical protein